MSLLAKVGTFQLANSGANQAITGVGFTAKAVLFVAAKTPNDADYDVALTLSLSS